MNMGANMRKTNTYNGKEEHIFMFCFRLKESPAPLNIPIPIPVPDRGGPVACLNRKDETIIGKILNINNRLIRY